MLLIDVWNCWRKNASHSITHAGLRIYRVGLPSPARVCIHYGVDHELWLWPYQAFHLEVIQQIKHPVVAQRQASLLMLPSLSSETHILLNHSFSEGYERALSLILILRVWVRKNHKKKQAILPAFLYFSGWGICLGLHRLGIYINPMRVQHFH